jgi:hypothetical protein
MAFTSPFVYLRAVGHLGSPGTKLEEWTVGFKLPQPGGTVPTASLTAFLDTVQTAFSVFHGSVNVKAGSSCFLDELQAAVIGVDGKYVGGGAQATVKRPYGAPIGGASPTIHSYSTALVYSLRTTLSRGYASNGRAYWPATSLVIDPSTGVVLPAATLLAAQTAATLLNSINQAADSVIADNLGVWVMSNVGAGLSAPVTSVRVGGKPDSQERREKNLVELYSSAPVNAVTGLDVDLSRLNVGERWEQRG